MYSSLEAELEVGFGGIEAYFRRVGALDRRKQNQGGIATNAG
jgi:hypothetical protein